MYLCGMMTINQQANQIYRPRVLWDFMETVLAERDLSRIAAWSILGVQSREKDLETYKSMKLEFQARNNEGNRKAKDVICQITTAAVKNKLNHFTNITCAIIRLAQEGSTHNLSQTFQLTSW